MCAVPHPRTRLPANAFNLPVRTWLPSIALALAMAVHPAWIAATGTPPQAPTPWRAAIHEAPMNLQASVVGPTVSLAWTAPGDAVDSWIVEAGSNAGLANLAAIDTGSPATGFATTGVPAGTYFVRVKGRFGSVVGPSSNEVIVTVAAGPGPCGLPAAPANLTANVSGSSVALSWNAAGGASGYVIEAGFTPGAADAAVADVGGATSLTASAEPGSYFVRVRGQNQCGLGNPSNEVQVFVGGAPGPGPAPCETSATVLSSASVRIGGTLTDSDCAAPHRPGHRADLYTFDGMPGTIVSVTMYTGVLSSNPYLLLVAPDGGVLTEAGGFLGNAFMNNVNLPIAGTYTIEATSLRPEARFAYTLTLRCSLSSPHCR